MKKTKTITITLTEKEAFQIAGQLSDAAHWFEEFVSGGLERPGDKSKVLVMEKRASRFLQKVFKAFIKPEA